MSPMELDVISLEAAEDAGLGFDVLRTMSDQEIEEILSSQPPLSPLASRGVAGVLANT